MQFMKVCFDVICLKVVFILFVNYFFCADGNVVFDFQFGFVYIFWQFGYFKYWFFVAVRGYDVGVCLLLDSFDGGFFGFYYQIDYTVGYSYLDRYLVRCVGVGWFVGFGGGYRGGIGYVVVFARCFNLVEMFGC